MGLTINNVEEEIAQANGHKEPDTGLSFDTAVWKAGVTVNKVFYPFKFNASLSYIIKLQQAMSNLLEDDVTDAVNDAIGKILDLPEDVLSEIPVTARLEIVTDWVQRLSSSKVAEDEVPLPKSSAEK